MVITIPVDFILENKFKIIIIVILTMADLLQSTALTIIAIKFFYPIIIQTPLAIWENFQMQSNIMNTMLI